ncbi:hypothetical protein CAPTEDRAFT_224529, partial [Capitella teleta]
MSSNEVNNNRGSLPDPCDPNPGAPVPTRAAEGVARRKRPTSRPPPPPIVDEVIRVSTRRSFADLSPEVLPEDCSISTQRTASFSSFKPRLSVRSDEDGTDSSPLTIPEDAVMDSDTRPWFDSVRGGDVAEIDRMLKDGQDVNARNK